MSRGGNGYQAPVGSGASSNVIKDIKEVEKRVTAVEKPDGTSLASLVQQVQTALANITTTVNNAINANSYTKAEINNRIANPASGSAVTGNISATGTITSNSNITAAGDITANNRVVSAAALRSPGSRTYIVSTTYAGAWVDGDGTIGISPSSRRYKQDIRPWTKDVKAFLGLQPVMFRYRKDMMGRKEKAADLPEQPMQIGLIAEDVADAGFTEFVFYDPEGLVEGINYDRLTVALLAALKAQDERLNLIEGKLATLGL